MMQLIREIRIIVSFTSRQAALGQKQPLSSLAGEWLLTARSGQYSDLLGASIPNI